MRRLITWAILAAMVPAGCGGPKPLDDFTPEGRRAADVLALPNLVNGLKRKNVEARVMAATAIGDLGPTAKNAVPDLIEALKDRELSVRMAAANALGQIGPDARPAVAALGPLAKLSGPMGEAAKKALARIEASDGGQTASKEARP